MYVVDIHIIRGFGVQHLETIWAAPVCLRGEELLLFLVLAQVSGEAPRARDEASVSQRCEVTSKIEMSFSVKRCHQRRSKKVFLLSGLLVHDVVEVEWVIHPCSHLNLPMASNS